MYFLNIFFFLLHIACLNPDKKYGESYSQKLSTQILGAWAWTTAMKYLNFLNGYGKSQCISKQDQKFLPGLQGNWLGIICLFLPHFVPASLLRLDIALCQLQYYKKIRFSA